jgi:hypothetical protein
MKGYVDSVTTAWTANAGQQLSDLGNLYANASSQQSTLNSLLANAGSQSDLIIGINANVTAANLGMIGYVDNKVSTANIGIIGYIDQGNTIQSNQISAANLGMKGYVDSVASQSIYGNGNVTSYTVTMGFTNYSNVNVSALITTNGLTNYSNVNAKAYSESMGYQNYGNVNVSALITTNGLTNYSNINLASYLGGAVTIGGNLTVNGNLFLNGNTTLLNTNNLIINDNIVYFANANPANSLDIGFVGHFTTTAYQHTGLVRQATTNQWKLFSNISAEPGNTIDFTNAVYDDLQTGNHIVTGYVNATGNVLATTFVGSGTLLTALPGYAHSNVNVKAYTESMGYQNYGNVNVAALITTNGLTNYSNVNTKAYTESMGFTNYSNVNVAALITTNGLTNYSNVNVIAYLAGNITVGNIAGSVNGYTIGYRDVPQITVANLTLIASDAGKHYYGSNTNPTTITIPLNSSVAFGNGTAISLVNQGTGNITITPTSGVLLYLAGNTVTGSKTLTSYGMATLLKVQVNTWFINGTGVV